jgi:hypothetical protein
MRYELAVLKDSKKAMLATVLIPELLAFKPSHLSEEDSRFSHSLSIANISICVLQELENIISKIKEMETIRELTTDEKLKVIDTILSDYEKENKEDYICRSILYTAMANGFITSHEFRICMGNVSQLAITLIPEFLEFKPEEKEIESESGWFELPSKFGGKWTGKRTEVLRQLRDIISKD